jgi:hypothetical protein
MITIELHDINDEVWIIDRDSETGNWKVFGPCIIKYVKYTSNECLHRDIWYGAKDTNKEVSGDRYHYPLSEIDVYLTNDDAQAVAGKWNIEEELKSITTD